MTRFRWIITVVFLMAAWPCGNVNAGDEETIQYIAFGDSIAKGYSCSDEKIDPYPALIQRETERETGAGVHLINTAKNGLTTRKLLEGSLSDERILGQLEQADIITITIGANDLIKGLKSVKLDNIGYQEILDSVNYNTFESDYTEMLERVTSYADDSAMIIVTNIYNPASNVKLPGTISKAVRTMIGKMNDIIAGHSEEYGYEVADLYHSDICDYLQSDRLHPTQEGQSLIAYNVMEKMDLHLDKSGEEPADIRQETAADEDGGARKNMMIYVCLTSMLITGGLLIALGICDTDKKRDKDQKTDVGDKR